MTHPEIDTTESSTVGRDPKDRRGRGKRGRPPFILSKLFERSRILDDPSERGVHVLVMHFRGVECSRVSKECFLGVGGCL